MLVLGVLLAHFLGDYVLQNNWIALVKVKNLGVASLHGMIQAFLLWFVLILFTDLNNWQLYTIWFITWISHTLIDRYRLVKPMIWAVNQLAPKPYRYKWSLAVKSNGGYNVATPPWMATWLMIIFDNTLHLLITFILLAVFL